MKSYTATAIAITCGSVLFSTQFCSAQIINGGLELTPPDSIIRTVLPGQSYAGWSSIGSGDIEFCGPAAAGPAAQGQGLVDLNGVAFQGAISQTLGTSLGTTYKVRFAMSGNPGLPGQFHLGNKTMDVLWNGNVVGSFTFSHLPTDTQQNLRWEYHELALFGNGNDIISFASTTSSYSDAGPMLDNITITTVPEPSVLVLFSLASLAMVNRRSRSVVSR